MTTFLLRLSLLLVFFLVHGQATNCQNNNVSDFEWISSNTVIKEDGLHLNPNLNLSFTNAVYLPNKINITSPWRLQFQFTLSNCYGFDYPKSVGNGLSVIIQDEPSGTRFIGLDGSNLGYCSSNKCGSNSLATLFDFYGSNNNQSFIRLVKFSTPLGESLVNATDPTGTFFPINAETCGVTFDTIVDYDGTNLSLYLESPIPWFSIMINFESMMNLSPKGMAYLGWTMGTGNATFDLIIHNVTLSQNCENSNFYISKEFCTHFPEYTIVNNTSQFYLNNFASHNGTSLYLEKNIGNTSSTFFFEKMVITKPWTVQFQFELSKCTLSPKHKNCTGDGFSFIIQGDQRGPFYVGDTGNDLGYFNQTENSMAVLYDFFGHCYLNKQFIRLVNSSMTSGGESLVNASDPTGLFKQTDISKCNSFYSGKVNYNGTHLSVFVDNLDIPWFNYQVNFSSELILEAGELAYVGWGFGCGAISYMLTLTNVTTSFYRRNCTVIPQPSIPEPSPQQNPQPLKIPEPSSSSIPEQNPEPQLSTPCYGNYGTLFTCKNGKWTSTTDVTLNGTNLNHNTFDLSSLFINENVIISDSNVNITNDLIIQKFSVLTLQNCSIFVNGDFKLKSQSTILLNDNFSLQIEHCAYLDGNLIISAHQSQSGMSFTILTSQCINGTFSSVFFNISDSSQKCLNIIPHIVYSQQVLAYFSITNQCTLEVTWIYIIIGIVGLFLLLGIITASIIIKRKLIEREKKLYEIDNYPQTVNIPQTGDNVRSE